MEPAYEVAVVGAGIAGLTCAALLARDGARVVLLEAHDKPGGCAGDFSLPSRWGRFTFPVGATVALGLEAGGLHAQVFERLGVDLPATPLDRLRVQLPDLSLDWHHDAAKWAHERRQLPGNRAAQKVFWRVQELVADAGWFALGRKPFLPLQCPRDIGRNLALAQPRILPLAAALPFSAGELLHWLRLENDRAFVALVNLALLITVQSEAHAAPLSNGLAGLDLWRHGGWHPRGGMGQIAWQLLETVQRHGGEVRLGTRVESLERRGDLWTISTDRGEVRARTVVANLPSANLERLLRGQSTTQKRQRTVHGWGAVTLYAALRDEAVPTDFPLHAQVLSAYTRTKPYFRPGHGADCFLSLSEAGDELSAPRGFRTLNVSTHTRLNDWEGLTPLQYRAQKKAWREKLLDGARRVLPDFDAGRLFALVGTPSTWERYTLRAGGSVGGVRLNRRNANLRATSVRTPYPRLFQVGDGTFPGQGTVACTLSGWNAAREIGLES